MEKDNINVVIMAGGIGSRFWPLSTEEKPKQFIDVLGTGRTLLQQTAKRFSNVCDNANIWVVTNSRYVEMVKEQLPDIPKENILSEPCRRNTAPCIAYVSWRIKAKNPAANIVVTPSDHLVVDEKVFEDVIKQCLKFTEKNDAIVTLGIKPTRPETGYGYIQADLTYSPANYRNLFRVDSFCEKPDLETAKKYIEKAYYLWNSGIFIWNVSTIVNAFRVYRPVLSRTFENLLPIYGTKKEQEEINRIFPNCENISVDYAILEKAEEVFVHPVDFGWSDLGTWGSLLTHLKQDSNRNSCVGNEMALINSHDCVIHVAQERKVVIQGLEGFIVAEDNGMLLICKLSEEQNIRQFIGS